MARRKSDRLVSCLACSRRSFGIFCLVPLVVGDEFGEGDRLVVVHLDGCVQNAVVRLEIRPRRITTSESL